MNKGRVHQLMPLMVVACTILSATAASVPEKPVPPFLFVPKTAIWKMTLTNLEKKEGTKAKETTPPDDAVVSMQCWLRGNDFKRVSTYASGRTQVFLTVGIHTIVSDSREKSGVINNARVSAMNSSEEQKFTNGYTSPFNLLSWISESNFVRLDSYEGKPAYFYRKTISTQRPEGAEFSPEPILCTVRIDAATKLPLTVSFGSRLYQIENLQPNAVIGSEIFAIPENTKSAWQELQVQEDRQRKLREMLLRKE